MSVTPDKTNMDLTSQHDNSEYYSDDYNDDGFSVTEDYDLNSTSTSYDGLQLPELCEVSKQLLTIKMFQTCVFVLVFLLGVLGNSLVIATFACYRRLRLRSMTDVFLFHLALADLLLLLTLPLQTGDILLDRWVFGVPLCKVTRASYAINTYSGLLLLACISIDRYVVVVQAQRLLRLRSRMLMGGKLASLGVWLVALLLSLPEILFSGVEVAEGEAHCGMRVRMKVKMAARGALIAGFCLPFLVMVVCYSLIGRVLCEGRGQGQGWRRQRTLRLMVALVAIFLLFQLPYTVVLSLMMAGPGQTCTQWGGILVGEYITRTLAYTRCCVNPILYALVGVRFRNDVLKLLHDTGCVCWVQLKPHPETCSSVSPSSLGITMTSASPPMSPCAWPSNNPPNTKYQYP